MMQPNKEISSKENTVTEMAITTSLEEVLGTMILLKNTSGIRTKVSSQEEENPIMIQPNKEINNKENTITEMATSLEEDSSKEMGS